MRDSWERFWESGSVHDYLRCCDERERVQCSFRDDMEGKGKPCEAPSDHVVEVRRIP